MERDARKLAPLMPSVSRLHGVRHGKYTKACYKLVVASIGTDSKRLFFQLPVAGQENPIYRERVYCYELYHHWHNHWQDDFTFSLCGEIDKRGHQIVRRDDMPDFLVHIPGEMTNLLIVEVKSASARLHDIIEDLKKITWFRTEIKDNGNDTSYL